MNAFSGKGRLQQPAFRGSSGGVQSAEVQSEMSVSRGSSRGIFTRAVAAVPGCDASESRSLVQQLFP